MNDTKQVAEGISGWAIVDLLGHLRMGGYVSEVEFGGARVGRIDIPAEGEEPSSTHFFGGQSIYRLTFVAEDVARMVARRSPTRPVEEWDFRQDAKKRLEESALEDLQRDARRDLVAIEREREALKTELERIAERARERAASEDSLAPNVVLEQIAALAERALNPSGRANVYTDDRYGGDADDEDDNADRGLPF